MCRFVRTSDRPFYSVIADSPSTRTEINFDYVGFETMRSDAAYAISCDRLNKTNHVKYVWFTTKRSSGVEPLHHIVINGLDLGPFQSKHVVLERLTSYVSNALC